MVATAIFLHFRPHRHRGFLLQNATSCARFYSSSSSSNSDDDGQNRIPQSPSQSQFTFSDVKASLKQTAPSPQYPRRPSPFNSNPGGDPTQKVASFEEIRNNLSRFHRPSPVQPPPSSKPVFSFQELYKRNVTPRADSPPGSQNGENRHSDLKSIRMSLKSFPQSQSPSPSQPNDGTRRSPLDAYGLNLKLRAKSLNENPPTMPPGSSERNSKGFVSDETKTEFVRSYSVQHMGEKLKKLRPGNKNTKFSLAELNQRLKKFQEMEEKEMQEKAANGGFSFAPLRESLMKLQVDQGKTKKNTGTKINILDQIGVTPSFQLSPPKEALVEKYFHPDHMSSAEKQKIELKNVRDKFKISESDCGSARVQVAQLTTKIKHLATVLHKKDKHSRKGLQAMVQKRKKLLKYIRRTDWESYCFCLSELGLRDSADYKA
ncbi:hypothetical protein SSX86_025719 [Deinandra increscens subsp. villosa]|uniref:Small ribosomal subunit protein uS15c n=1 Tax=Deinandra increscens subsp. villosa TaxID=3103831 RepID=A0AAP0CDU3_9ASTR